MLLLLLLWWWALRCQDGVVEGEAVVVVVGTGWDRGGENMPVVGGRGCCAVDEPTDEEGRRDRGSEERLWERLSLLSLLLSERRR